MSYESVKNQALPSSSWLEIDSHQLTENVRRLSSFIGKPILASVKANGYGHDLVLAARAFLKGGAVMLGVARLAEGVSLRRAGMDAPILVLCGLLPEEIVVAAAHNLDFFVWQKSQLDQIRDLPKTMVPLSLHIKVDTGMGRLGCFPHEVVGLARELQALEGVVWTGLATHFSIADDPKDSLTEQQIKHFDDAIRACQAEGLRPRLIHAANSAGALYFNQARYDMARFGISAYGVAPNDEEALPPGVKPALSWRARLIMTKILPKGHGVSYGHQYTTDKERRIGLVPVGYGDGYRRLLNINTVLVGGEERNVLGRICMDQCLIDLDGMKDCTGEEVVLLGQQGERTLSAETLAQRWNTIPYEVFTSIHERVPRRDSSLTPSRHS